MNDELEWVPLKGWVRAQDGSEYYVRCKSCGWQIIYNECACNCNPDLDSDGKKMEISRFGSVR